MSHEFYRPYISKFNRPYWEGLQQGKLLAQHCKRCNERFHPPQAYCPICLTQDYEWFELNGTGTLYCWTEVLFLSSPPHIIGVIELEEEIGRSIAKIEAAPEDLKIGLQMQALFIRTEDATVLAWKPE